MGACTGLSSQVMVISQPPRIDGKGNLQKRGKMIRVRSGVVAGLMGHVVTPEDWCCKNWKAK